MSRSTPGRARPWCRVLCIGLVVTAAGLWNPLPAAADETPDPQLVTEGDLGTMSGYALISESSNAAGRCVDIQTGIAHPWLYMRRCNGGSNQDWDIQWSPGPRPTVNIISFYNGECIDGYWGRGQTLKTWNCDRSLGQEWYLWEADNGFFLENAKHRNQCIDIRDWGRDDDVQMWDCHWGDNQRWYHWPY